MYCNLNKYYSLIWLLALSLIVSLDAYSQEESHNEEHEKMPHHRVALMIAHTHVPKALGNEDFLGGLVVPSWGLDYEYWINHKWAIGLHSDMEVATYVIEDFEGEELERERPIIVTVVGIYKIWKEMEILVGLGKEFEPNHNFYVLRLGLEYEIEIGNEWDIAPSFIYDAKEDLYNSWTVGLAVGKRF